MRILVVLILFAAVVSGCDRIRSGAQALLGADQPEPVGIQLPDVSIEADPAEAETGAIAEPAPGPTGAPGRTIASLGDPAKPGMWLETTRVSQEMPGRIVAVGTGTSAHVTLRPIPGTPDAGGRLSLEAMRMLGVPLTELVELQVYPGG